MTDPRIARTRRHVLDTTRRVLAEQADFPLNFTTLAQEAQVSRRTLYTHWGSIERVIGEAAVLDEGEVDFDPREYSVRERLDIYLKELRSTIHEPVTRVALATLMNQAAREPSASGTLSDIAETRMERFRDVVGPIDADRYAELVGPLFLAEFLLRMPASDALIATLVERGVDILGSD